MCGRLCPRRSMMLKKSLTNPDPETSPPTQRIEKPRPVVHIRVMAPEEMAKAISEVVAKNLCGPYELIEFSGPRPIFGDDDNVKYFLTVR